MMERRIKERLIGATVLVVLVVLIVPELLSGPRRPSAPSLTEGLPAAATRNVSVDLSTSKATTEADLGDPSSAASSPGSTAAPPTVQEPGSASNAPGADDGAAGREPPPQSESESAPTVTTLRAQKPSASTLESTPSAPISSGAGSSRPGPIESAGVPAGHRGWSVQLGSFASKANAEKLVHQLATRGGPTFYVSASGGGSTLRYRVRMGPLADRGAAERAAGKLRASGHAATIVAPAS